MLEQLASAARIDFRPRHAQPAMSRVALATIAAVAGSLAADALLVVIAQAVFPATRGYAHFQFGDYAKLTVIGVIGACLGWPIVTRISSAPRWLFFRLAVLVTLVLWLPDVYILYAGQPAGAVGFLFVMHVAIALVTYNLLVHLAPAGPVLRPVGGDPRVASGAGPRPARRTPPGPLPWPQHQVCIRPGGPVASPPEPASIYDWAVPSNLQPEPITLDVWRNLPEEFCRQVELVNGQAVRCEKPTRAHQAAASRIAAMLDAAADAHMARNPGTCLDTSGDFDVLLWEIPATTIRSPDAALFDCAPNDTRPLPASLLKVVVEVVSPGSRKADKLDKMAEYADAGIPFYWLVWLSGEQVLQIDIHVLDHTLGYYRLYRTLNPEEEVSTVDVPVRIQVDWARLAHLVRG